MSPRDRGSDVAYYAALAARSAYAARRHACAALDAFRDARARIDDDATRQLQVCLSMVESACNAAALHAGRAFDLARAAAGAIDVTVARKCAYDAVTAEESARAQAREAVRAANLVGDKD